MSKEIKNIRKLWKPFVILFLLSFLIINWGEISSFSPYFNYNVVWAKISEPFVKFSDALNSLSLSILENRETKSYNYFNKENVIKIPKIKIQAPIVFLKQGNEKDFAQALKKGVLYYPDSALPGEKGIITILGHSAPTGWPKINYDWVFTDLNKLETGNIIYIYFNNHQYNYRVKNRFFLKKGEEIPSISLTNFESVLVLLSCWPPGENQKRIAVEAVLQ